MDHQDLQHAANHFDLTIIGEVRFGLNNATVSAPCETGHDRVWLRVAPVPEPPLWPRPHAITEAYDTLGELIRVPRILDTHSWPRWDDMFDRPGHVRAHVIGWEAAPAVSSTPQLTHRPDVTGQWWDQLKNAADTIAETPGAGPGISKRQFMRWVRSAVPASPALAGIPWAPQHGDFHWANLLSSNGDLVIVDWEGYSLAPRGLDAATLLTYSLTHPETAETVEKIFSDDLNTEHGMYVQTYVLLLVMTAVQDGFHPELAQPIRERMRWLRHQLTP